jgi:hypothetical protein
VFADPCSCAERIWHDVLRMCTDANLAGLSNEAMDLESVETSMLIVKPIMGVWPHEAPDTPENVTLTFEKARCVAINGKKVTPLQAMLEANNIAGRNGVGITHALENRLLGTKSRGVYEAPGMTLLGEGLALVYAPPCPPGGSALGLSSHTGLALPGLNAYHAAGRAVSRRRLVWHRLASLSRILSVCVPEEACAIEQVCAGTKRCLIGGRRASSSTSPSMSPTNSTTAGTSTRRRRQAYY